LFQKVRKQESNRQGKEMRNSEDITVNMVFDVSPVETPDIAQENGYTPSPVPVSLLSATHNYYGLLVLGQVLRGVGFANYIIAILFAVYVLANDVSSVLLLSSLYIVIGGLILQALGEILLALRDIALNSFRLS
jgi:hypothetical protein